MLRAQIVGEERIFGRYQQFVWQDRHGLPQNGISAIVKTPDGYLWLAIAEGVVRFDGVRFTAFDTGNTPEIRSNNVQSLLVGRDGTLWIGTHGGGLTSYRDGRFTNYSAADGLSDTHIKSLFEDSKGNLWIGTDGGGLDLFRDGKFTVYTKNDGLPGDYILALAEDAGGSLWIGGDGGLARLTDGKFNLFNDWDGVPQAHVGALFFDREHRLWIGGTNRLGVLGPDGKVKNFTERDGFKPAAVHSIAEDPDGALLFGTDEGGLVRLENGKFETARTTDGLVNDTIQAVYADADGDLWLGTNGGGLAELRRGKFRVYTTADGLPSEMVGAVFADEAGAIWIGTEEGLCRFKDGRIQEVKTPEGTSIRGVNQISADREGDLWMTGSSREIVGRALRFHEETGRFEYVKDNPFASRAASMIEDRGGRIWIGTSYDGLHRFDKDGGVRDFHKADGLADEYVSRIFEDRAGAIWIGTRSGLSRFEDGKLTTLTAAAGFTGRHVLSFHEDDRGNLWIGTDGDGLFRYRDGRFGVVTAKNGLYDNLAFQILGDDRGNLWMSGNKGIYRARIDELEDLIEGRRATVDSFSYGSADGMLSRECNGANPGGARDREGKLWFPTIKGVVVVDPDRTDTQPPAVTVENVLVDEKPRSTGEEIVLAPDEENLEIRFGAISWNRPQQIRFKYRLAGLDDDWVEAGTRRTAYYPHIRSGNYTFQVIADNGEGVWNTEGRILQVRVLPPFYRTWWFLVLCSLAVALLIRLIYNYRLQQLEKINEVRAAYTRQLIEYQEMERQRVAVELHDSIGQSLIVIRNRALMGLNAPDKHDRLVAQLEEISESAADSIREVRQIAHNLHPYQLEHLGLKTALESMIEQAAETSAIDFDTEIDEIDDTLSREAEINLYRIVQESMNNILKHSEATAAEIKIIRNNGNLNLTIRDNGKGFAPEKNNGKKSGLGLAGISERARILGARYDIRSGEGRGTTVNLTMELKG